MSPTAAEWSEIITTSVQRTTASAERYAAGERRHWYFIHTDYCPVCGSERTGRERIYGDRPEDDIARRSFHESYDYCDVM